MKQILGGALRKAAQDKGPVRKAVTFGEEEIKSFLTSVFWPTGSRNNPNPSLKDWRTATRLLNQEKEGSFNGPLINQS